MRACGPIFGTLRGRDYSEVIENDYDNGTATFPIQGLPKMSAYRLRRFHQLQGITECIGCHGDVLPYPEGPDDGTTPITQPPYYQSAGGTNTTITGTCNLDGSEDGTGEPNGEDTVGLDNDGDGVYDTADDDCPTPCMSDTDCDDGVSCTDDVCDVDTGECSNTANDGNCADGEFCDGDETCDTVDDCQPGTPVDCDDGVGCTVDSCNEGTNSCDNVPDDAACIDGQFCNGDETCDPVNDCQPGTPPCDPATEICNEETDVCEPLGCVSDAECDDGQFCNGAETCDVPTGQCVPGTPVDCNDGVGCTVDSCNEGTDSCDNVPDDGLCADGQFCNGDETCDPVDDCQPGTPPCDPATEICDEDTDICEPPVGGVDLDIYKFTVSKRVIVDNPDPPGQVVKIKLWVYNAGEVDEPRLATVVGMQGAAVVYSETMMVSNMIDGEPTLYKFLSYDPENVGMIQWTATFADDDPDVDEATATTMAVGGKSRRRARMKQ